MKASDPYHPSPEYVNVPGSGWEVGDRRCGLTIRQRYIMAAMQGLCASPNVDPDKDEVWISRQASRIADATLRAAGVDIDERA